MTDHAALSSISDTRTLRTLRSSCVIEAFNLHAAVHYQHSDSMLSTNTIHKSLSDSTDNTHALILSTVFF